MYVPHVTKSQTQPQQPAHPSGGPVSGKLYYTYTLQAFIFHNGIVLALSYCAVRVHCGRKDTEETLWSW